MKGDGSSVPGGIIVISLEIVKVLASIKDWAWVRSTPKVSWKVAGLTFARRSENKKRSHNLIIVVRNDLQIHSFRFIHTQQIYDFFFNKVITVLRFVWSQIQVQMAS